MDRVVISAPAWVLVLLISVLDVIVLARIARLIIKKKAMGMMFMSFVLIMMVFSFGIVLVLLAKKFVPDTVSETSKLGLAIILDITAVPLFLKLDELNNKFQ